MVEKFFQIGTSYFRFMDTEAIQKANRDGTGNKPLQAPERVTDGRSRVSGVRGLDQPFLSQMESCGTYIYRQKTGGRHQIVCLSFN